MTVFDIEIAQAKLVAALSGAGSIADKRSNNMPILANVLLHATKDSVSIAATDMTLFVRSTLAADVRAHGSVCVSISSLLKLVRTLPDKPLRITGLDNHWVQLRVGRSEFKLMGVSESDFPELPVTAPKTVWQKFGSAHLRDLIDKTGFSVSTDEARVNLNGALFESDGKHATMVTTDGHRLTKLTIEASFPSTAIIIPRRGLLEIRKFFERHGGEMEIAIEGQHLFVRNDSASFTVKLNNVVFPPYQQVIPKDHRRRVIALRVELIEVLRRAEVMASEKTATVQVTLGKNVLVLSADNPDLGAAREEMEVEFSGEDLVAGFNARYLLDILEAMSTAKVALEFQGELDPCVVRPVDGPDYLSVVMPMRI